MAKMYRRWRSRTAQTQTTRLQTLVCKKCVVYAVLNGKQTADSGFPPWNPPIRGCRPKTESHYGVLS
eukprot:5753284-Lingulodinium_polyedra.AAC.1